MNVFNVAKLVIVGAPLATVITVLIDASEYCAEAACVAVIVVTYLVVYYRDVTMMRCKFFSLKF